MRDLYPRLFLNLTSQQLKPIITKVKILPSCVSVFGNYGIFMSRDLSPPFLDLFLDIFETIMHGNISTISFSAYLLLAYQKATDFFGGLAFQAAFFLIGINYL